MRRNHGVIVRLLLSGSSSAILWVLAFNYTPALMGNNQVVRGLGLLAGAVITLADVGIYAALAFNNAEASKRLLVRANEKYQYLSLWDCTGLNPKEVSHVIRAYDDDYLREFLHEPLKLKGKPDDF